MTVHKAMYGVDPILSEKIQLSNFADKRKTLILFDESDQAAVSMRNTIIDQAIESAVGNKRFAKGYNGYLQYKSLIDKPEHISNEYYGTLLENSIHKAQSIIKTNWERTFNNTEPYKSIFLDNIENLEDYRRGVFFSGPAIKFNISQSNNKTRSCICHKKGNRHFCLTHCDNKEKLKSEYDVVVPMDKFLSLAISNTTAIKSQLRKVITESLQKSRVKFDEEQKAIANNQSSKNLYLGYPTLEREIHTLLSRFETTSEFQFEQQMNEFMTNRKNLSVKNGKESIKLPDFSVYSQGIQLFQEEIDERDNQHRVRLSCREITTTPEKIIVDLANSAETSVVFSSATASSNSVVSNYDMKYLKQTLGEKVHSLSVEDRKKFDELVAKTYPEGHKIEIVPVEKYEYTDKRDNHYFLPDKYKAMFSKEALDRKLDEEWFRITLRELKRNPPLAKNTDNITFQLYRLFQFIESYYWFYTHNDIHSMLSFQNRTGDKDRNQIQTLSCLIDGSFVDFGELDGVIPTDWKNKHIRISKDWDEVESNIIKALSESKEAKLMLVSAYGSFKAGANMQYEIPDELDYIAGDNWESSGKKMKKDWDAVYLQAPTSYLTMNEDGSEQTFEKSLYNAMLTLMMLYERGCLSKDDITSWMCKAFSNTFYFGDKNNPGISKDKSAWAQTVVEQAVGRLCRTRNKPRITYILFDKSMIPFFKNPNLDKSLTKEFSCLVNYIKDHPIEKDITSDPDEVIRCNNANHAQGLLDRLRRTALRYTPHLYDDEEYDDDDENTNNIPHNVWISQVMNQSYKQTIIRKPVISSNDDLKDEDKKLTFVDKCYGDWIRNEQNEYTCYYDDKKRICPSGKGKQYLISPSTVRLDILMKNAVIKEYFKEHGYATDWQNDGLILHPQILATDYAGEIGEEAFKAIVLHYTDCKEENLVHLEGKDYELADFVIRNADGTYKIAFDVKNMNPQAEHDDRPGDIPTSKKREIKRNRLGCEIITVNMLEIEKDGMDEIHEIGGVITKQGDVIPSAIERIKKLING